MKLLCLLDSLPAADIDDPGVYNKKGGSYPAALRALVDAGYAVALAVIDRRDQRRELALAERLGVQYLCDGVRTARRDRKRAREWLDYPTVPMPDWTRRRRRHKARKFRRQRKRQFAGAARLIGEVERAAAAGQRFDHVFAMSSFSDAGLLAALLAEPLGLPFTVWERQTVYARRKMSPGRIRKTRAAAEQARMTLAVSPQLADEIGRVLGEDLAIGVLPNIIGESAFAPPRPDLAAEVAAVRNDGFLFASWTAWRDFKRLDVALAAFARLVDGGRRDARFLVAGRPPPWAADAVRHLGIDDRVTFAGNVSREYIRAIAHGCDCAVVPSDHETFGLPVIEAMAGGNPTVATRCGGPESIITDERLGCIVECGDIDGMADRMARIMDARASLDDDFIRAWCREHYGDRAFGRRIRAILEPGAAASRSCPAGFGVAGRSGLS